MDDRCVIFYDSGTGGMSLMKRVATAFPDEDYLYYGDFGNLPYGNKNEKEIKGIVAENLKKFVAFSPKLVVVACNTASTVACEEISGSGLACVKVLPAVGKNGRTLLLCTRATAESRYVKNLSEKNSGLEVLPLRDLAQDVENYLYKGKPIDGAFYFGGKPDYVSLGCTHYSLVADLIAKKFPDSLFISGEDRAFSDIKRFLTTFAHGSQRGSINFINGSKNAQKAVFDSIKVR